MATISSILSPNLLHHNPTKPFQTHQPPHPSKFSLRTQPPLVSLHFSISHFCLSPREPTRLSAVAEETSVSTSSEAARRLYVGNIPRTVTNDELRLIVEEHGAVEKAEVMYDKYSGRSRRFAFVTMKTVEDANAAVEKLNGTQVGGREIKVNVTEKPLQTLDMPLLQAEESQFIDSPHKVYVGNLAKTVTTDSLKTFFSEKGKVLSAKVSRVPGTSKSSGFGFVSFSSEEDVEASISSLNNALLEGQKIRVNKA
ncbi:30S ribosomal protein like [Actinidia chinensis var. chinensis]|uniref:Small ribosomal subunit protein cS22 n=1 Tax=Actinidia chinensis var. chinensis TaxID=1590841 RepID=A0A2R6RAB3_ACTCC|nr:30S ribosomal protein like [Actinidia chinensis var. chinensis]